MQARTLAVVVVALAVVASTGGVTAVVQSENAVAQRQQASSPLVVEDLEAPQYARPGSTVVVNATIRNTGTEAVREGVSFRIEGEDLDLVVHRQVRVGANDTTAVSFELDTAGVPSGDYIHGVTTRDSSDFAVVTLTNDSHVDFDAQASDGRTVTVDSVFVPEGGFVTIHDATLLEGDAFGSVVGVSEYLAPGFHEDVSVTLFEGVPGVSFEQDRLPSNQTLIAMPHLDSNGNEQYDFVAANGSADGPYVVDGEAVTEASEVTVANATA